MTDEELTARWDDYVESMGSVMGRAFEEDAGQQHTYVEQLEQE